MVGKINVFGDSIAWGSKDTECGGWVDRLKIYFSKTGDFNQVRNLGISGATSNDLLERLERETIPRKSARGLLSVIAVPINDARYRLDSKGNRKEEITKEQLERNLVNLHQVAKKHSDEVMFVGLTGVDEEKTLPWKLGDYDSGCYWKNENIKRCNNIVENFCKKKRVLFLDMKRVVSKNDLYDGLHPNAEGHKKMFEKARDFLIKNNLIEKMD